MDNARAEELALDQLEDNGGWEGRSYTGVVTDPVDGKTYWVEVFYPTNGLLGDDEVSWEEYDETD